MTDLGRSRVGVLQKRAARPGSFGKAKRARFLDALAATCNAALAARHAGTTAKTVHCLRRRDGEFARLWAEAIDLGQERLREELIARALGQVDDGENPGDDRDPGPARLFDPELALRILQAQARIAPAGQRRAAGTAAPSKEQVYALLAQRLDEAEARVARREGAAGTGDAAGGPVLIGHAPEER